MFKAPNLLYTSCNSLSSLLSDTITPVSVYLKVRDRFPNSILLESSDYRANDNTFSYICCNPIASINIQNEEITKQFPDGTKEQSSINKTTNVPLEIEAFSKLFDAETSEHKFPNNGLFGYIAYDGVRYFEDIDIAKKANNLEIPDIYYAVYQNIISISA